MKLLACTAALALAACAHESWDVVDPAPDAASRALPPGLGLRDAPAAPVAPPPVSPAPVAPGAGVAVAPPETKILGSIDPEAIRKVIRDHAPQVRWCYEQRLAVNPALAGKLTIRWHIESDGHVSNAAVVRADTTLADGAVGACVVERLAGWEFPKPARGGFAIVSYPWLLRSNAPEAPAGASAERGR